MKSVIVTGASGFIGRALVRQLVSEGNQVYAIVRKKHQMTEFEIAEEEQSKFLKVIVCDMAEIKKLPELLKENKIDIFYHFAWEGTAGEDRGNFEIQLANVHYTCEAVKIAKVLHCRRFLFAGSLMEWESIKFYTQKQSQPAINYIYRTAKLTAHYMAKAVAVQEKIEFIQVTISNIYGPGETSPRFINTTLRKWIKGEVPLFTSGEQLYDFIYITDAVRAITLIACKGQAWTDYYVGSRELKPLKEYLEEMRNCVNPEIELKLGSVKFDGVTLDGTEFDRTPLYTELGFHSEISFQEGIKKTLNWLRMQEQ